MRELCSGLCTFARLIVFNSSQVIDVEGSSLQNVITFPPDGAFIVDSGIKVVGDQRVEFKFQAAALKVNGTKIPFPPFGQGWYVVWSSSRVLVGIGRWCWHGNASLYCATDCARTQMNNQSNGQFSKGVCCRFDTVYMDDDVRIAEDIRGDTLIVARDGPPRKVV
jgi:hypothetical protein